MTRNNVITVDKVPNEGDPHAQWIRFKYENGFTPTKQVFVSPVDVVRGLLLAIGENPDRPGLVETPERVVRSWQELFGGYMEDPAALLKVFTDCGAADEMVVSCDIPFTSFCEHHMLPFSGVAHVGYLPQDGKVVGLSKLARLVDVFARRLQVQERMTTQIADALFVHNRYDSNPSHPHLNPKGVGIVVEAEHGCMACRGVRKPGVVTVTSALRGAFKDDPATRSEFLALTRNHRA